MLVCIKKSVVHLCRWTSNPMYTIFNTKHSIVNLNDIYNINFKRFKKYLRGLERTLTDWQTECINSFQFCQKVLKMITGLVNWHTFISSFKKLLQLILLNWLFSTNWQEIKTCFNFFEILPAPHIYTHTVIYDFVISST